jgi:putative endonuclease
MKNDHTYFVYMLTNRPRGVLYTGVTNDLLRRVSEHRTKFFRGFALRYGLDKLVWYEVHHDIEAAILREKRIKRWRREWKFDLVEADNPGWQDLWTELTG